MATVTAKITETRNGIAIEFSDGWAIGAYTKEEREQHRREWEEEERAKKQRSAKKGSKKTQQKSPQKPRT
jgi:hypothetical protein